MEKRYYGLPRSSLCSGNGWPTWLSTICVGIWQFVWGLKVLLSIMEDDGSGKVSQSNSHQAAEERVNSGDQGGTDAVSGTPARHYRLSR